MIHGCVWFDFLTFWRCHPYCCSAGTPWNIIDPRVWAKQLFYPISVTYVCHFVAPVCLACTAGNHIFPSFPTNKARSASGRTSSVFLRKSPSVSLKLTRSPKINEKKRFDVAHLSSGRPAGQSPIVNEKSRSEDTYKIGRVIRSEKESCYLQRWNKKNGHHSNLRKERPDLTEKLHHQHG